MIKYYEINQKSKNIFFILFYRNDKITTYEVYFVR